MPRQVTAKNLAIQKSRPYSTAGGVRKKVPCANCKSRHGATQSFQNLKKLRTVMAEKRLVVEATTSQGVIEDAEHILAAMGIGRIEKFNVQPNPRSDDRTQVQLKADFTLLKVETDNTAIENPNIFDTKSLILKRGETKLVRATELVKFPTDFQEPFFKPDDQVLTKSKKSLSRIDNTNKKPTMVPLLEAIYAQQQRIDVKHMSSHFKIAFRQVNARYTPNSFDAVRYYGG